MDNIRLLIIPVYIFLMVGCESVTDFGDLPENEAQTGETGESGESILAKATNSDIWVGAYLGSYNHYAPPTGNWGNLPTNEIDWDAFTHLFYFSLNAKADGTLSSIAPYENMSPDRINAIVSAAHANNKPVLFTVGGWGNHDGFSNAIKPVNRAAFVANLVATMTTWGFDGIDLDMEPINDSDVENYTNLVKELRQALDLLDIPLLDTPLTDRPLLTAATLNQPAMFADLHSYFDQINLMTYDLSGAWEGWVSWHNSPIYNGGHKFPGINKELPSIEKSLDAYIAAGVPATKLGIGIDFYGYVWNGQVDAPRQNWVTAPTVKDNVAYWEIMENYYSEDRYNWDAEAGAAYLSITNSDASQRKFISYDDERAIRDKLRFARNRGIGGTIIWELGGGYQKDKAAGKRDVLLQAVKNELLNGGTYTPPSDPEPTPEPDPTPEPETGSGSAVSVVYKDALESPWINTSWNASVDYNNREQVYADGKAIKVTQNAWGALSMRKGNWGQGQDVGTSSYEFVEFVVFPKSQGARINVMFENDSKQTFPRVSTESLPAGRWTVVRIPLNELNPQSLAVHRISFMESSGASRTYFVDQIRLTGGDDSSQDSDPTTDPTADPTPNPGTDTGSGSAVSAVYKDALESPWINTSWNASVDYNNWERVYSDEKAIKVAQNAWGALSMRSGNWGQGQDVGTSDYEFVEFVVFPQNQNTRFNVFFENDGKQKFPRVTTESLSSGKWTLVRIPLDELNSQSYEVHRLNIMESSGASRTYFIDQIRFTN